MLEARRVLTLIVLDVILENVPLDAFVIDRNRVDAVVVLPNREEINVIEPIKEEAINVLPRRVERDMVDAETELPIMVEIMPLFLLNVDTERTVVVRELPYRVDTPMVDMERVEADNVLPERVE